MTTRERNLRARIDKLTEERDHARARRRRGNSYTAHCVYCAAKTKSYGQPATCPNHRDLVSLDPFYDEWAAVA